MDSSNLHDEDPTEKILNCDKVDSKTTDRDMFYKILNENQVLIWLDHKFINNIIYDKDGKLLDSELTNLIKFNELADKQENLLKQAQIKEYESIKQRVEHSLPPKEVEEYLANLKSKQNVGEVKLKNFIKNNKFNKLESLKKYIMELNFECPYIYINKYNVNKYFSSYDYHEKRIFAKKELKFKNMIIDLEYINLADSDYIEFDNCIVLGKVCISEKSVDLKSITIGDSIFLYNLTIRGLSKKNTYHIDIFRTNIFSLVLKGNIFDEFSMNRCKIYEFEAYSIAGKRFVVTNSLISHFNISDYKFESVNFDFQQIKLENVQRISSKYKNNNISFLGKYYQNKEINKLLSFASFQDEKKVQENNLNYKTMDTIAFLKKHSNISLNKDKYNLITFYEGYFSQRDKLRKIIFWITGGFSKPSRFVIIGAIIYFGFAFIYIAPQVLNYILHFLKINRDIQDMKFIINDKENVLNAIESFYFSGVTFATIGYGDISPTGYARVFAVMEGVFGIATMSALLTSFIKKYID